MPQIVSPQTGNLAGGTDSSGNAMGAVIFDKPDTSGTEMLFHALQNNAKRMDDQQIAKQKAINARSLGLLDKIDINKNGVFEPDLPYFQEKTQDLVTRRGDIYSRYGGDLTSKEAMKEVSDLEGEKVKLQQEAFISAADKERYVKENQLYLKDLGEYDPQLYDANNSEYLKHDNLGKRAGIQRLHESTPDLITYSQKVMKDIKPSKETEVGKGVLPNGRSYLEIKKDYTPEQFDAISNSIWDSERGKKSVERTYNNLPPLEKAKYELLALKKTQQAQSISPNYPPIVPQREFLSLFTRGLKSGASNEIKELAESPYSKINTAVSIAKGKADITSSADEYAYQQLVNGINGDIEKLANTQGDSGVPTAPETMLFPTKNGYTTNTFDNIYLGKINVPQPVVQQGEVVKDANGKMVTTIAKVDDNVLGTKFVQDGVGADGKPKYKGYYYSTGTILGAGKDLNNITQADLDDPTIYKPLDVVVADRFANANKLKLNRADFYQKRDAYKGNTPQVPKATSTQTIPMSKQKASTSTEAPKVDATEQAKKDRINKIRVKAGLAPIK